MAKACVTEITHIPGAAWRTTTSESSSRSVWPERHDRFVAERVVAVVGAMFLVAGPAKQAAVEIRKAEALTAAWQASDLTRVLNAWVTWSARWSFGGLLKVLFVPLLVRRVREGLSLWGEYKAALDAFEAAADTSVANAELVDDEIKRALNWGLVLVGSVLVFAATVISLIAYAT